MLTSFLIGCNKQIENTEKKLEPITLVFYTADGKEDPWTDPVAKEITKATGVTIQQDYPVDGDARRISLMIASKEYPDMIFAKGDGGTLIEAGALIDLRELIEEYGPNIKKLYGDSFDKLTYSEEDPSIYQLPSNAVPEEILTTSGTAQLQWAVLKENNYKIPYTLDEYESMIKSYINKYPTINGKKAIGISISCSDWHWYTTLSNPAGFIANGAEDNGQWIIDDKDNYRAYYKYFAKGQKEYFKWLNRMYHEGILDKDFATQTHEEYMEKIASGRVIGLLDTTWNYNDAEMVLKSEEQYERTYAGLPVTLNEEIICAALKKQGLAVGWGIGITTSCKDPVRAIQFLDYLCSEEGQILLNWGIEGVNYSVVEGKRVRTIEEVLRYNQDTNYKEETGIGLHNYPFPTYGVGRLDSTGNSFSLQTKESVTGGYNVEQKAALEAWGVEMLTEIFPSSSQFEEVNYAPVWSQTLPQEFNDIEKKLDAIAWPGLIDCIVGEENEFDEKWEALLEQFDEAGRKDAEDMLSELIRNQVKLWQ